MSDEKETIDDVLSRFRQFGVAIKSVTFADDEDRTKTFVFPDDITGDQIPKWLDAMARIGFMKYVEACGGPAADESFDKQMSNIRRFCKQPETSAEIPQRTKDEALKCLVRLSPLLKQIRESGAAGESKLTVVESLQIIEMIKPKGAAE